jgi:hypothetical protein
VSAQPVFEDDPLDPQVILDGLPEQERPEFLRQYRAAAQAAFRDVAQYKALRAMLHRWSLAVIATNQPGYYEAIEDAKAGRGEAVPLAQAIAAELARRS